MLWQNLNEMRCQTTNTLCSEKMGRKKLISFGTSSSKITSLSCWSICRLSSSKITRVKKQKSTNVIISGFATSNKEGKKESVDWERKLYNTEDTAQIGAVHYRQWQRTYQGRLTIHPLQLYNAAAQSHLIMSPTLLSTLAAQRQAASGLLGAMLSHPTTYSHNHHYHIFP